MAAADAMTWPEPVRIVTDRLGDGIEALLALLFSAELAALGLSVHTPVSEEGGLSRAAWSLAEAREELEWVRPGLAAHGVAIDLGPAPAGEWSACRDALASVLRLGVGVVTGMLRDHVEDLDTAELLAVARATTLLSDGCTDR